MINFNTLVLKLSKFIFWLKSATIWGDVIELTEGNNTDIENMPFYRVFLDFKTFVLKSNDFEMTDPWVGHFEEIWGSAFG